MKLIHQWPSMCKSVVKDSKEKHHWSINLNKAKERLQEEDQFDQEGYKKEVKAYGEKT